MVRKKRKLKKQVYYVLAGFIGLIVLGILGMNYYNDFKYRQTNEFKLLDKGYSNDDTNIMLEKLSENSITMVLNKEKDDAIVALVKEKYFLEKNLEDYLTYIQEEEETNYQDVVAIVNVHANQNWYEEEYKTDPSLNELMLVNKFYALDKDYTPENLVNIPLTYAYGNEGDCKIIDYAYEKFVDLWQAAKDAGYYLMVNSSYRDYAEQEETYNYLKSTVGERKADERAARAGHSEHQTGLVVDMTSIHNAQDNTFKESEEYAWLQEHAHEYGFIERYPEGKTYITGYNPESWHLRYVGIEAATQIHEEGITFDEYYAFYIAK